MTTQKLKHLNTAHHARSVLLVGLGDVAVGYDVDQLLSKKILSHARAFSLHPAFKLAGGVDPNGKKRDRFSQAYGVPAFAKIKTAMHKILPDVVVVATPTTSHLLSIKAILAENIPQVILCEKPLAYDFDEASQIVGICSKNRCRLFTNFFRLVEPGVTEIRKRMTDGRISRPLKGTVWYSKGIFNSGSHFLNLLQNLLGEISSVYVKSAAHSSTDLDPQPDCDIAFRDGKVVFLANRNDSLFHNSMDLISSNGRLRYEHGGAEIYWQSIEKDKLFKGYSSLSRNIENIRTDFDRIQWYVADKLAAALEGRETQLCSGIDALQTQKWLNIIKSKL